MALFNRKKTKPVTTGMAPARQSTWVVWLLSILTFIITVFIVLGLFWAGRWVVHQFTKQPASPNPAATKNQGAGSSSSGSNPTNNGASPTPPSSTPSATTPSNGSTPSATTTTPATPQASSGTNLVNTGPTSDE